MSALLSPARTAPGFRSICLRKCKDEAIQNAAGNRSVRGRSDIEYWKICEISEKRRSSRARFQLLREKTPGFIEGEPRGFQGADIASKTVIHPQPDIEPRIGACGCCSRDVTA
jgi:hypothetical protein